VENCGIACRREFEQDGTFRLRNFRGSGRGIYMDAISKCGWRGSQCQPPVKMLLYRRLALTTACRNVFIQAVVNANRLYKIISILSIFLVAHFYFIFNVIYSLHPRL